MKANEENVIGKVQSEPDSAGLPITYLKNTEVFLIPSTNCSISPVSLSVC